MSIPPSPLPTLVAKILEALDTSKDLLQLKAIRGISLALSIMAGSLLIISVALIGLLMMSVGLGLWMNQLFENTYSGFLLLAVAYLLLALLLFLFRKRLIQFPLRNRLIKTLLTYQSNEIQ